MQHYITYHHYHQYASRPLTPPIGLHRRESEENNRFIESICINTHYFHSTDRMEICALHNYLLHKLDYRTAKLGLGMLRDDAGKN